MSVFFNMLGIRIESYEHALGPPRVLFDSEFFFINFFLLFFKPFFNGLNGKFQNVKKYDPESVFGVVGLIFKPRVGSLHQGILSLWFI